MRRTWWPSSAFHTNTHSEGTDESQAPRLRTSVCTLVATFNIRIVTVCNQIVWRKEE